MAVRNVHPLLVCQRGRQPHVDWYDQDECAVTLFDGVPIRHFATAAPHESEWKCAVCRNVSVTKRTPRADALDAVPRSR
jgi:hypothetical protein